MRAVRSLISVLVIGLIGLLAVATPAGADDNTDEWSFVELINQARADNGLEPLAAYGPMRDVARPQSIRMGEQNRLYHNPNLAAEVAASVPDWQRAGENVGKGWDVEGLHKAFMDSPGHRANILGDYNYVGLGVVHAGGFTWVTEVFLKAPAGKPTLQGTATPPPPPVPVTRLAGATDADTALAVARRFASGSATAVVVGRSDVFADALAGGPLAAVNDGPVLLTAPDRVSGDTVAEATRILRSGGTVYLLGGNRALSPAVEAAFANAGLKTERLYGNDRYETAIAVARKTSGSPAEVFVVSGTNFADAIVAGPVAGSRSAPIVLADPAGIPLATRAYLLTVPGSRRTVIGGTAAVSDAGYQQAGASERVAGADRYDTAVKVAGRWLANASALSFATGGSFQDALAGAALSARDATPLLLLSPTPGPSVRTYARSKVSSIDGATVYGTPNAVTDRTVSLAFS